MIMISAADSVSGLDFYDFTQQVADVSEGRLIDGGSLWGTMDPPTPGASNQGLSPVGDHTPDLERASIFAVRVAPNPFNPQTEILFSLGRQQEISVAVYDVTGRRVRQLHQGVLAGGEQRLLWDGTDEQGHHLASGAYFARINGESATFVQKMLLIK